MAGRAGACPRLDGDVAGLLRRRDVGGWRYMCHRVRWLHVEIAWMDGLIWIDGLICLCGDVDGDVAFLFYIFVSLYS